MPFTVITMGEVNIVNLERVGFNLRNFDMTIVFKARCRRLHGTDMFPIFTAVRRALTCTTHPRDSELFEFAEQHVRPYSLECIQQDWWHRFVYCVGPYALASRESIRIRWLWWPLHVQIYYPSNQSNTVKKPFVQHCMCATQDLTRDVVRIDAIPSTSLDTIRVRPPPAQIKGHNPQAWDLLHYSMMYWALTVWVGKPQQDTQCAFPHLTKVLTAPTWAVSTRLCCQMFVGS